MMIHRLLRLVKTLVGCLRITRRWLLRARRRPLDRGLCILVIMRGLLRIEASIGVGNVFKFTIVVVIHTYIVTLFAVS